MQAAHPPLQGSSLHLALLHWYQSCSHIWLAMKEQLRCNEKHSPSLLFFKQVTSVLLDVAEAEHITTGAREIHLYSLEVPKHSGLENVAADTLRSKMTAEDKVNHQPRNLVIYGSSFVLVPVRNKKTTFHNISTQLPGVCYNTNI